MSEKPGKRMVNKRQYVALIGARARLIVVAVVFSCWGIMWLDLVLRPRPYPDMPMYSGSWWICTMLRIAFSAFGAYAAYRCLKSERKIERVKLVTRYTSHLLPAVETLVRASDLPRSHQQAELLRAAKPGQETPPEEMLRATTVSGREE